MAPAAHRGQHAAEAATASRHRSARLAELPRKSPAPPPPAATVALVTPPPPQTRRQPRRRRRPFLPFRRPHDQSCLTSDVARHQVVFVHAWPGTGKSTQIPRVLHATSRHGRVLCSQTYRLAAESTAAHVASYMRAGEVRCCALSLLDHDESSAAVTYTTHHALLRAFASDPLLTPYGTVVVDEADDGMLLTGAVLTCVRAAAARRPDLRVVIRTHGTLCFGEGAVRGFFPGAEHLRFDTNHGWGAWEYLAEPATDYVAAAVDTVRRVHATEPPGDVLAFLPSYTDVEAAGRLLAAHALPDLVTRYIHDGLAIDLIGDVLRPTPDDQRKVVLATDVADSAVFVEGINYIVDSGYRCTDNAPPSLTKGPSPSSPPQMIRALKAAVLSWYHIRRRESRGKCFCLYTMEEWDEMIRGCSPLRSRTDDVDSLAAMVLVLKDLGITSGDVENFGFVLPPRPETLQKALAALVAAGMVGVEGEVTEKGRRMASEILDKCYF
ncbi:hypothetical protein HU200_029247 [Digitaria exilis]|uniref:Helicase ATP-binding domain-containing protein n=1 Tax=Digitaria exilis TaxID=1010633 RepID=A0A835BUE3_9POAL|nr:hypothetical protein HU200_029247 [Digitaria exilis]